MLDSHVGLPFWTFVVCSRVNFTFYLFLMSPRFSILVTLHVTVYQKTFMKLNLMSHCCYEDTSLLEYDNVYSVNNYQNFGEVCYLALNYHEDEGSKLLQTLVTILQSTRCHMSETWNI
jgi:hypothetical protein